MKIIFRWSKFRMFWCEVVGWYSDEGRGQMHFTFLADVLWVWAGSDVGPGWADIFSRFWANFIFSRGCTLGSEATDPRLIEGGRHVRPSRFWPKFYINSEYFPARTSDFEPKITYIRGVVQPHRHAFWPKFYIYSDIFPARTCKFWSKNRSSGLFWGGGRGAAPADEGAKRPSDRLILVQKFYIYTTFWGQNSTN